jgi:hypothetical protein
MLIGRSAFAQDAYPPPPPPPTYYAPPPPPNYYYRPRYYYPPPPPWVRPPRLIRGFIGVSGLGTIVADQRGGVEYLHSGGGFGIFGGLDIGRFFGIEIGYDASFHNPIGTSCDYSWCSVNYLMLEAVHLDAKLHLPTGTRVMPYLQGGVVASWIGRTDSPSDAIGGGFEAGGGIDFWLSRQATFGIQAMYRGLAMSDYATYTGTGTYLSLVMVGGNFTAHF